jgi:type II secretory pathway predicted ATPase ExeA
MKRISTTIVTGGVGAGKTACTRALLAALPLSARAAVCVHSFALSFGLEPTSAEHERVVLFHDEVFGARS